MFANDVFSWAPEARVLMTLRLLCSPTQEEKESKMKEKGQAHVGLGFLLVGTGGHDIVRGRAFMAMERIDDLRRDAVTTEHLMELAHRSIPRVIRGDVFNTVLLVLWVGSQSWVRHRRLRDCRLGLDMLRLGGRWWRPPGLPPRSLRRKQSRNDRIDVDTEDLLRESRFRQNAGWRFRIRIHRGLSGRCSRRGVHVGQPQRSCGLVRPWRWNTGRPRRRRKGARNLSGRIGRRSRCAAILFFDARAILISTDVHDGHVSHLDDEPRLWSCWVTIDRGVRPLVEDPLVDLHRR